MNQSPPTGEPTGYAIDNKNSAFAQDNQQNSIAGC